jgi:prolyl oligopeptidase
MKDAVSVVKQYDYSGKMLREIELPGLGSAGGFSGKKKEETLYYSFTNYTTPELPIHLKLKKGNQQYIKTKSRF